MTERSLKFPLLQLSWNAKCGIKIYTQTQFIYSSNLIRYESLNPDFKN